MPSTTLESDTKTVKKHYPNWRVIVLNDDHNTFEHVIKCFVAILPQMTPSKAEALAMEIHTAGAATVWSGAQEQAEMYHMQLGVKGITMAPLEQE
jgi:ATP-dependent Clp protease adaptor protein ClpS